MTLSFPPRSCAGLGENLGAEMRVEPFYRFIGNALDIEHVDPLARQFAADRVPYRLNVRHQGGGGVADLGELLSRRAPVRRTPLDVLKLLALESRHADHEEFVEVRSRDRQEAESLEQRVRSEEHTSELQSLMRISYAVFCL